ncbi:MAG: hypothetical protein ABSE16_07870 [Verrucomicrobiota bacterium]|jgi:hypothetical protein
MAAWQALGGGLARVSIYQHDRDGVGYLIKGLGHASEAEMNYEFQKFGSRHCDLMLSNSAIRTCAEQRCPTIKPGGRFGNSQAVSHGRQNAFHR